MKPLKLIAMISLVMLLLSACTPNSVEAEKSSNADSQSESEKTVESVTEGETENGAEVHKIKVMTTLFPQYDFAKIVGGDKVEVTLLLPPGVEAHSYEPTPQDIISIQESDLFVYTGEQMEPWVHKMVENVKSDGLTIVDSSKGIELMMGHHHDHEGEDEDHDHDAGDDDHDHDADSEDEDHDHEGVDPHIWLDPVLAKTMVDNLTEGLILVDPENEAYYQQNADAYKLKLDELDNSFRAAFEKTDSKTIIYGGHFAFGYFAKRYGLENISPFEGFSPDAEPTPAKIAELIENLKKAGTHYIFYEELVDPKIARIISEETGAEMLLLHGAHNVSKEERESGITYIEIMQQNLENLKIGLGYHE